jgi:hypothetical protein
MKIECKYFFYLSVVTYVELVTIQLQEREIDRKNERIRFSLEGNQSVTLYIYNSKYQLSHY